MMQLWHNIGGSAEINLIALVHYTIKATQKNKPPKSHKNAKHVYLTKYRHWWNYRFLAASARAEYSPTHFDSARYAGFATQNGFCSCLQKIYDKIKRMLLDLSVKFSETSARINPQSSLLPPPSNSELSSEKYFKYLANLTRWKQANQLSTGRIKDFFFPHVCDKTKPYCVPQLNIRVEIQTVIWAKVNRKMYREAL